MNLLEQFNKQEATLEFLNEQEELLNAQLKMIEKRRREILSDCISEYDVLTEILEKVGISDYKYISSNYTNDHITACIMYGGKQVYVKLYREEGGLLIDGEPVNFHPSHFQ